MAIFTLKKQLLATLILVAVLIPVQVLGMESQQYQLQSEEITSESINPQEPQSLEVALASEDMQMLNQKGFFVTVDNADPFSFSIPSTNLSFGTLSPGKVVTVSNSLSVTSKEGYQVMLSATRPLTSLSGSTLLSTRCDKGCSYLHATPWNSNLNSGIGYTLIGKARPEDFINERYFRPLAYHSKTQEPVIISKTSSIQPDGTLQLFFKVVPSASDTESYSTIVSLGSLPAY